MSLTRFRPIKSYRAEVTNRKLAQRLLDYSAAQAAEEGTLTFDPRGARLTFRPLWRAVLERIIKG